MIIIKIEPFIKTGLRWVLQPFKRLNEIEQRMILNII